MPTEHSPTRTQTPERKTPSLEGETSTSQQVQGSGNIEAINMIKLPPFWKENPAVWFAQVEMTFAAARITSDEARYRHVGMNLDVAALPYVIDLLTAPPRDNKYDTLKERIITAFDLLENVQAILAISESNDINKLAQQADKIMEAIIPHVAAVTSAQVATPSNSIPSPLEDGRYNELKSMIEALSKKIDRSRCVGRGRSNSRGRSKSKERRDDLCYYHSKFGKEAYKCKQPCSRKGPNTIMALPKQKITPKMIKSIITRLTLKREYLISPTLIDLIHQLDKTSSREEITHRSDEWNSRKIPYPTISHQNYAKVLYLTTGSDTYLQTNVASWKIPRSGNRNIFEELVFHFIEKKETVNELTIMTQVLDDIKKKKIKIIWNAIKRALRRSSNQQSPKTPKPLLVEVYSDSNDDEEEETAPEEIEEEAEDNNQSKTSLLPSSLIERRFPFLGTECPKNLFCQYIDLDQLSCILSSTCIADEIVAINKMKSGAAWAHCDKYYFWPWMNNWSSQFSHYDSFLPTEDRFFIKLQSFLTKSQSQIDPKVIDVLEAVSITNAKISMLQDQLLSVGHIKPPIHASPIVFQPKSPILPTVDEPGISGITPQKPTFTPWKKK